MSVKKDKLNLIYSIKKKFKKIDIIVNNAALTGDQLKKDKKISGNKYGNLIKEIDVNLLSIIEITEGLKKNILNSKEPSIINLSSIYGFTAPKFQIYKNTKLSNPVGYSVSKGGVIQLTRWMAAYLSPRVRVNCVSPGGIKRKQPNKFINSYKNYTLLKKMASDEDVMNGIIFLSSQSSKYITGHNLVIDGGWSI